MAPPASTNIDFLTRTMPDNWWTRALKSMQTLRVNNIRTLSATPIPSNSTLCNVCKAIDWEYLLIGNSDTGLKHSSNETICLGLRSEVEQRGQKGCSVCAESVGPLLKEIDREYNRDPDVERIAKECVHLDVSDVETQQFAQMGHGSYCANVSILPVADGGKGTRHEVGIVCADENGSFPRRECVSKAVLLLVDDTLSAYRSVPPYVDYSRCKMWLDGCGERHSLCNDAYPRDEDSPIKLIDVLKRSVVSLTRKGDVKYAALSYVCGPGYSLCVLGGSEGWKPNEDGNLCHMLPNDIPATTQDAMTFTGQLGLRYLWVDSICIAQDNEDEKITQIGLMYSIYSDATVTIVSAAGEDSHTPLAGVSACRKHLPGRKVTIKEGMNLGLPFPALGSVLAKYRYMRRAWTYQELLLSKRIFFFTSQEVFFYCAMSTSRESRLEQKDGHVEAETWASMAPESNSHLIGNVVTMRQTKDSVQLRRLFAAIAQEYSSRELSFQEDTINAFKGVEGLIKQLINDRAVSGCPHSMLLNCLTWKDPRTNALMSQHAKRRMCTKTPKLAVLPTWVWCSHDGPVKMRPILNCYPQSVCRFYIYDRLVKDMSRILPELARGIGCTCSKPEHNLRVENYSPLPIHTRTATLTVVAEGDDDLMPGQADLSTVSGEVLGSCDFRGQTQLNELNGSEVTLMQLYFQKSSSSVTVLILSTCKLLDACSIKNHPLTPSGLQEFLVNLLVPEHNISQTVVEAIVSASKSGQVSEDDAPEAVRIKDDCIPELENVLVGSRLGIAFVSHDTWAKLQTRESVVVLI